MSGETRSTNPSTGPSAKRRAIHPFMVRLTHWINAAALIAMVMSGWRIYDASPIFPFRFPGSITLGGWLAGALAWHFAAMWLLVLNGLIYVGYGLVSGHFRQALLPLTPAGVWRDFRAALALRLPHALGRYNAVQRLLYVGVILLLTLAVLSGLAIWKPVQLHPLTALLGGYDTARIVHFLAMSGIVGFFVVHIALVILVPRTLPPMIVGGSVPDAGDALPEARP
ncbi:MAG: cytochrome b/b6 domain-containing protein [Alphaproteobacteria bacterium]|nr:cytochrome b/b6 domain-containing protein [Alphaproteobacteria bacterium]